MITSPRALCISFLVALVAFVSMPLSAQNNTNSPYTRFGYGQLFDGGFGRSQGMGGISYGLRSNKTINPMNPASYSSIDSTSLLFDVGVSGLLSNFSAEGKSTSKFTGNLEYLGLQFPVTRWMGVSVGMMPFSTVGYQFGFTDSTQMPNPTTDSVYSRYSQTFSGSGGISQVYLGLSFDLFKRLSIGINGYYMFGTIDNYRYLNPTVTDGNPSYETMYTSTLHIRNFNTRIGLQYHQPLKNNQELVIGAVYEFQTKMSGDFSSSMVGVDSVNTATAELFDLPNVYGLGLTYMLDNRLLVGADFTYQEFAKARYFGRTDSLNNRMKVSVGAEYTHRPTGMRYIDRMSWRLGANYSNSYINVGGQSTRDFAITCGVGFPLRTIKSVINLNFEYGKIGTNNYSMINERYFKFGLNVALNELWFFKTTIR